jgi:hypothetical protein
LLTNFRAQRPTYIVGDGLGVRFGSLGSSPVGVGVASGVGDTVGSGDTGGIGDTVGHGDTVGVGDTGGSGETGGIGGTGGSGGIVGETVGVRVGTVDTADAVFPALVLTNIPEITNKAAAAEITILFNIITSLTS